MFHLIFSLERKLNQKIPVNGGGGSGQWSVMLAGSPSVVQGVRVSPAGRGDLVFLPVVVF